MATVRRRLGAGTPSLSDAARARLDRLTPAEIEANALADTDNPPLTDDELARGAFGRRVRRARERLGLSQRAFADRFHVNLRRLQDWEQGRFAPDSAILAYITIVEREPDMVTRVLAGSRP